MRPSQYRRVLWWTNKRSAAVRSCAMRRLRPREPHSGVGFDVLHNDDDLPVGTFRDRVPDGQIIRRKMETVRTWQRVCFGERVGKCRDWFFEQVKNRSVSGVSKWLRQPFELVPGPVREAKNPVT